MGLYFALILVITFYHTTLCLKLSGNITTRNMCLSSPCIHGNCVNSVNGYTCVCAEEYTGVNCENHRCNGSGNWLFHNNQCYRCVVSPVTWRNARAACHQHSADLVTVTNSNIQSFLEGKCSGMKYWIGLNDRRNEGVFVWLDSTVQSSYSNWDDGEPNDSDGEDCVHFLPPGTWNDIDCSANISYICHKPSDINECLSLPCHNGECVDLYNGYKCICQPGYSGTVCNIDIDECQSSPCIHGNCSNLLDEFQCQCFPGYAGIRCEFMPEHYISCGPSHACNVENDIDECQSSPCIHGNCSDLLDEFQCQCFPGYAGIRCESDIDECLSSPCMHGTCVDLVNAYRCLCQPGYSGTNCEIEVNECQSSPCVHGQCVDEINAFKCECDFGYFGSFCSEFNYQLLWILLSCLPIFMVILFIAKRAKIDKLKEDEFNIFVFPEVVRGESKPKWRSTERNECVHT